MGTAMQSCFSANENPTSKNTAIGSDGMATGQINDIDEAALQAIKNGIGRTTREGLKQTITLSISCENLPNLDTLSKSDPFCVVYELKKRGTQTLRQKVGRTETIIDSLNPSFVKSFDVDYYFEEQQTFLVEIFDMDDDTKPDKDQEHIGSLEFMLHNVVTGVNQTHKGILKHDTRKNCGTVKIMGEQKNANTTSQTAIFQINGDCGGQSGNLFLIVWKWMSPGVYRPIFKTECKTQIKGLSNWNGFKIDCNTLCNNDFDQEFKIDIFKYDASGSHKLLSSAFTTVNEITNLSMSPKELNAGSNKLILQQFDIQKSVNFLDYVFGGCQINLSVAIDFTMSNGPVHEPQSLHSMADVRNNEYMEAIKAVGEILQYYDSDKAIPAYGFGARVIKNTDRASHCFALNGDIFKPECNGIYGVLEHYRHAVNTVQLHGPTNFEEIIDLCNQRCEASEVSAFNQQYQILMIITDGIITDFAKTVDQIVRASDLPMSILIVGVGGADFDQMEQLDADVTPLYSNQFKKYQSRDNVQFVPFRQFKNDTYKLAKETLQEIPGQLTDYFLRRGIFPKPASGADRQVMEFKLKMKENFSLGQNLDLYTQQTKQKLIQQCMQIGLDAGQVQQIVESGGLFENQLNLVMDILNTPGYYNPLKIVQNQMGQQLQQQMQAQFAQYQMTGDFMQQMVNMPQPQLQQNYSYHDPSDPQGQQIPQQQQFYDPQQQQIPQQIPQQQQTPQQFSYEFDETQQ